MNSKTVKNLAIAVVATVASLVSVNANASYGPLDLNKEKVVYLGNLNELPVFQLSLDNAENATYLISIKDDEGQIIYSEKVNGKNIVRNYQFEDAPLDAYSLTFEVNNLNTKAKNVYKVNKAKKVLDEVAVSKIK
ncbi:MAG: hypothetical protein QM727_13400 [Niabella sp.]